MAFKEHASDNLEPAQVPALKLPQTEAEKSAFGLESPVVETRLRLAKANAWFYRFLLSEYLTPRETSERHLRIAGEISSLPGPVRRMYEVGVLSLVVEISETARNLDLIRGEEVKVLLGAKLLEYDVTEEKTDEILEKAGDVRVIEPNPGIAIMRVSPDFFELLRRNKLFREKTHAVYFNAGRGEVGFMIIQSEPENPYSERSAKVHETSHLVWNFLGRSGFLRTPDYEREANGAKSSEQRAFEAMQNEVIAYLSADEEFGDIEADYLVYSDDGDIRNLALNTRDYLAICMKLARPQVDGSIFIYAAMTARNFDDLKTKFSGFTPHNFRMYKGLFGDLFDVANSRTGGNQVVKELVEDLGIDLVGFDANEFFLKEMNGWADYGNLNRITEAVGDFVGLCQLLGIETYSQDEWLKVILDERLGYLPEATREVILRLRNKWEDLSNFIPIPAGAIIALFLEDLLTVSAINYPGFAMVAKKILASDSRVREAFEADREWFIGCAERQYRESCEAEVFTIDKKGGWDRKKMRKIIKKSRVKVEADIRKAARRIRAL